MRLTANMAKEAGDSLRLKRPLAVALKFSPIVTMASLTDLYQIDNYIDTFALGHYARVFDATDQRTGKVIAFKVLRPEHLVHNGEIRWEYRAFPSEADLLTAMSDSPHVVRLQDCGYVSTREDVPTSGEIVSYGTDIDQFRDAMTEHAEKDWRPYLALENLPRTNNLLYLMKPSQQSTRWRLPSEEGLALALQFGQMLKIAHSNGIIYLDHKLEHVYWDGAKLCVIDFNSSRQLENRNGDAQFFRMDIHNLCVGILYPLFTGLSPQKTTLRPQPSDMNEVEKRYQDIQTLDFGVEPGLSVALQEFLQRGASMRIESIEDYFDGLRHVAALHGWDFNDQYTSPASREARDHMRAGLRKLREGQMNLRDARDLFRDAVVLDGITDDLEDELRRLVIAANDMLNNRVIP